MLDLSALDEPVGGLAGGQPLLLPVESIDEDPEQPRVEFDDAALMELAETIGRRGVRQPVSVRPHPSARGRWMLNFGARRLRATKLAGKACIPAFVDTAADSYDQVIENEQRLGLTHMELALFVKRRIAAGDSQSAIARGLGKSKALITYATALIDPPECLVRLYRDGICTGIAELYELRRLHDNHGDAVAEWARSMNFITRRDVALLKERLSRGTSDAQPSGAASAGMSTALPRAPVIDEGAAVSSESARPLKRKLGLLAECAGGIVHLLLDVAPSEDGSVYVQPEHGGQRALVALSQLKLLRVAEVAK